MGGEQSNLIPMPQNFHYMAVTFRAPDKIRLIYPKKEDISITREAIKVHWPKGIQWENIFFESGYDFKMKGNPFGKTSSKDEVIQSKKLANDLLLRYSNKGLELLVSTDLSKNNDLTTWVFSRENEGTAYQYRFACIDIRSTDALIFIGFQPELQQRFEHVVTQNWRKKIQKVNVIGGAIEIKMVGNPWLFRTEWESIQSKTLVMALINALARHSWFPCGSSNFESTTDTIFFAYHSNTPVNGSALPGFIVNFNQHNLFQAIDAVPDIVKCVKNVLLEYWPLGLKKEKHKFNAHEFKLKGITRRSWFSCGQDGMSYRYLMCKLFEVLLTIGWRVHVSVDVARKSVGNSVFMFRHCLPMSAPVFCLSLNRTDRIRFINAPQDVVEILSAEIRKYWIFGIGNEGQCGINKEIKLCRNPWGCAQTGYDGSHGRVLLCHLLKVCASIGWFIIVSGDVSVDFAKPKIVRDVHSWWFMRTSPPPQQSATDTNLLVTEDDIYATVDNIVESS